MTVDIMQVRPGLRVRLTIDRSRFNALDVAYLLRQSPRSRGLPPLDGRVFLTGECLTVDIPRPHRVVTLHNIGPNGEPWAKEYLAEAHEIEVVP